jgi:hypothetical protein
LAIVDSFIPEPVPLARDIRSSREFGSKLVNKPLIRANPDGRESAAFKALADEAEIEDRSVKLLLKGMPNARQCGEGNQ